MKIEKYCGCIVINKDYKEVSVPEPDILILDPPFDYAYSELVNLDAKVICVFSRGAKVFEYLLEKINKGYGYHSIVNLTPANGANAPFLPANTHEIIHILRRNNKGDKAYFSHDYALSVLNKTGKKAPSVLNYGRPTSGINYYKYAKPLKVMCYLMSYSPPGSNVYDPFCGSTTALQAAIYRNNNYIGCDINDVCMKINRSDLFNNVLFL